MRRLLVALLALVVVAGTGGLVAAQSTATVGVDAPASVTAGQSASGTLVVTDVTDPDGVGSFTVNVTYDPAVVTVTASGTSTFDVSTSHPEPGVLTVVGYTGQYPGPNGTVTLAGLSITGEAAGSSSLDTTVESITDADGDALANTTSSDSITVQQSSSGDGSSSTDGSDGSDGASTGSSSGSTGGSTGSTSTENGTADLQVVDATLSAREVAPGESVTVTATVENSGNASGTAELTLAIDGTATGDSRLVEVPAGKARTVSIETTLDATGEYAVSLGGVSAGTLSVVEPDTPTATETQPVTPTPTPESPDTGGETPTATETGTPTDGNGSGFGLLAALVALALVALRRR